MVLLKYGISVALFVSAALAQGITIVLPAAGSTVTPGSSITVQVGTNIFVENLERIAIAIGLQSCPSGSTSGCSTADQGIGTILYTGLFDPVLGPEYTGPYQDFTVTIPASTPAGQANLAVANFFLVGASQLPSMNFANASLIIA
ncbi:hypothetical protein PAXINDRAFT_167253 [Paxillus involutus ATCC 200175]|nr:hypothetical protein PAXINDRAFT_167253 [Paxillus involutus ATCC 200175]